MAEKKLEGIAGVSHWSSFLACIALLGIIAVVSGCMTAEKATGYLKEKGRLAEVCATEYPVRDSTIYIAGDTITEVIEVPGDSLLVFDTIWQNQYSIRVDTIRKYCPPTRTTTKIIHDTVQVWKENTAKVHLLEAKNDDLRIDIATLQKRNEALKKWRKWLLIITIASLGWNFRKLILKLF